MRLKTFITRVRELFRPPGDRYMTCGQGHMILTGLAADSRCAVEGCTGELQPLTNDASVLQTQVFKQWVANQQLAQSATDFYRLNSELGVLATYMRSAYPGDLSSDKPIAYSAVNLIQRLQEKVNEYGRNAEPKNYGHP